MFNNIHFLFENINPNQFDQLSQSIQTVSRHLYRLPSFLFTVSFDDFGITDEYNPWGLVPGLSIPAGRENPAEEGRENPAGAAGEGAGDAQGAGDAAADDYDYGDYPTGASGTGAGHPTGHSGQGPTGHSAPGGHPTGHAAGHAGHAGQSGGHSNGLGGFLAVFGGGGHSGHGGHGSAEAPNHYYRTARSHGEHQHRRFKRSRENYNPHPLGDR